MGFLVAEEREGWLGGWDVGMLGGEGGEGMEIQVKENNNCGMDIVKERMRFYGFIKEKGLL